MKPKGDQEFQHFCLRTATARGKVCAQTFTCIIKIKLHFGLKYELYFLVEKKETIFYSLCSLT